MDPRTRIKFNEFQEACKRTANTNLTHSQAAMNWALGIAGEAGEYCELIKKSEFHGKKLDKDHAKKELGDILYYVAMAATNLGIDLASVAQANVDKLTARYPEGFKRGGGIRQVNNDHEDDGC
ncbi:MAG: nucleotide pyrophosphohydrolase [Altibacter sp.]|uniref:nucleoside triphosphate pyrophosphohydrolase family protein n=1 Tax=Altibacter sp. TaxID=2024823 RepID=UPI000C937286|nr:nucleoside triphosphate pyrophosphohydrolase family protein [Altibacter sp.]MAP55902.1 nucleotide pyrophosphohydrolase [Altibacter sp.]|tara:strand:- start:653 stop:1021 length:369 start_codon:yes stop_codon:yes gene_type:complete